MKLRQKSESVQDDEKSAMNVAGKGSAANQ